MLRSSINKDQFIKSFRYSIGFVVVSGLVIFVIFLIIGLSWYEFPIGLFSLITGGLLLTVSGCIGPGRYRKDYKLLLYQPEDGSSYSKEVVVSGFVRDPNIKTATILVNGKSVGQIRFGDDTMGRTTIDRKQVIDESVNKVTLEYDGHRSNERYFTFFDYTSDMSDEEIDELIEIESSGPSKPLEEARKDYLDRMSTNMGSIALGIGAASITVMIAGSILDFIIRLI